MKQLEMEELNKITELSLARQLKFIESWDLDCSNQLIGNVYGMN